MPWHWHIQTTICKSGIKNNSKYWSSLLNKDTYETRVTFESAVTDSSYQRRTLSTLFYQIYLWSRSRRWTVRCCIQCFSLHSGSLKLSSGARRETECDTMSLKRYWKLHMWGLCEQCRSISIPSNWSWRHHNSCGNYSGYSCMLCCAVCASSSRHGPRLKDLCKKEQNGNICQWLSPCAFGMGEKWQEKKGENKVK